jgi:hypothetical protein
VGSLVIGNPLVVAVQLFIVSAIAAAVNALYVNVTQDPKYSIPWN